MATAQDIARLLVVIGAAYPNWNPSKDTAKVYLDLLGDLPGDQLLMAARQAVVDSEFPPTVHRLRHAVAALAANDIERPTAHEAWGEVKRAVSNYGSWGKPQWSHPLIGHAVDCIGWLAYCQSETDDEPSWRSQFIQAYESLERRQGERERLLPSVRHYMNQLAASKDDPAQLPPAPSVDAVGSTNGRPKTLAELVEMGAAKLAERNGAGG